MLDAFDLRIAAGERVAIVGPSGSGKSTVAMLVSRFNDPDSGAVLVDGHDLRTVTLKSLRRQVGVAFEDSFLFSESVRDNIAYGRPDASDAEIEAAARTAGGAPVHQRTARRLRHHGRRTRPDALRRPTPAHRPRPRHPHRSAHPHPGRRHQRDRREDRGGSARRAARRARRAHHAAGRASPLHPAPRRPDRRAGQRQGRRTGHARRTGRTQRHVPDAAVRVGGGRRGQGRRPDRNPRHSDHDRLCLVRRESRDARRQRRGASGRRGQHRARARWQRGRWLAAQSRADARAAGPRGRAATGARLPRGRPGQGGPARQGFPAAQPCCASSVGRCWSGWSLS